MNKRRTPGISEVTKQVMDLVKGTPIAEEPEPIKEKDPLAVELGRRGGLKGGRARAEKLTPNQRSEIAKRAAQARWGGNSSE